MDNCDCSKATRLVKKIESFISESKGNGCDWPEVANSEIEELNDIIRTIIDIKFKRDCDGDSCVEFELIDRTRYEGRFLPLIPHKVNNELEALEVLRSRAMISRSSLEKLESGLSCRILEVQETFKKK